MAISNDMYELAGKSVAWIRMAINLILVRTNKRDNRAKQGEKTVLGFIEKSWIKMKIAFDVQDPLQKTGKLFDMHQALQDSPQHIKRRLTICNLFANHAQSVDEIAKYYDIPRSQVIGLLIEEGFLKEQRKRPQGAIRNGRRQTDRTNDLAKISPAHHSQFE